MAERCAKCGGALVVAKNKRNGYFVACENAASHPKTKTVAQVGATEAQTPASGALAASAAPTAPTAPATPAHPAPKRRAIDLW